MADEIKTATGVKAQETAAPAAVKDTFVQGEDVIDEIDDTDDPITITDEDDTPAPVGKTVKQVEAEPDRNAVYADMRRRAESEARVKATQEAQSIAQKEVDKVFADMGLNDPYTGKPINTKAEYDAYKARHNTETISKELSKAGISREAMDALIDSHPAVQQAKIAATAYESAQKQAQEGAAKVRFDSQLKEITELDADIKTVDDLFKQPNIDTIKSYIKKNGLSIVEAYKLANMDKLSGKQASAAAQSVYNKATSKDHLTSTAVRGQGEISMTKAQLEQYRRLTGKTDKQIREDYAKHLKKYS